MGTSTGKESRALRYRVPICAAWAIAWGAAWGSGCDTPMSEESSGHGVLLVAIDGLRADHVGALGAERPATPTLDGLAEEGWIFSDAFTAAPRLRPAHIGLLTGTAPMLSRRYLPSEKGEHRWMIPTSVPKLAVEFLAAGYRTAAFFDEQALTPVQGIQSGFQRVLLPDSEEYTRGAHTRQQARRLQDWVRSLADDTPWFAYLHLADLERSWSDPIQPWDTYFERRESRALHEVPPVSTTDSAFFGVPHSRWRGGSRYLGRYEASYDGHIRKLDEELGALLAGLRRMGRHENTTIVVVGTFGIQFGEAGLYISAGGYSLADLAVPWILRPRRSSGEGAGSSGRVDSIASLLDVAPTLLELEGLPIPVGMHGVSQLGALGATAGKGVIRRHAFATCGLIEGYTMVGEESCLELLWPRELKDRHLRRSWTGEFIAGVASADPIPDSVRFYDRGRTPFPSLVPLSAGEREKLTRDNAEFVAMSAESERWFEHVRDARSVLQGSVLRGKEVEADSLAELIHLGYLGQVP